MTTTAIVAIFKDRGKAFEAARAIKDLEAEDAGLTVNAGAVIGKDEKGNASVLNEAERPLWGTGAGMVLGGLIGILGGPLGVAAGAGIGGLTGLAGDATVADFDEAFVDDVAQDMNPSDTALVLEADEGTPVPVDAIIDRFGGRIHRTAA